MKCASKVDPWTKISWLKQEVLGISNGLLSFHCILSDTTENTTHNSSYIIAYVFVAT
jgi:hypothetical protein